MKTRTRSAYAIVTAAIVFSVLVAFLPQTNAVFWPPKSALLLLFIALGLPRLLWIVVKPGPDFQIARRPAIAAIAFLGVAGLSTIFAETRTTAIFGLYLWGNGLLFVASLVSAWAIGISLDDRGKRLVTAGLLSGLTLNVVVAVLQMLTDLSSLDLTRYDGRSPGIQGNPVHLGALMAAGTVLALPWERRRLLPWLGLIYGMAAAVQVSGSRSALLAMFIVIITAGVASRSRNGDSKLPKWRLSGQRAFMVALAIVLGLTAGAGLSKWGGGASVSERITAAEGGGGVAPRMSMWWTSRQAVADNPLVGSGPGTYREATSKYRTISVARAFGADLYFTDAHNLIVEYATTTGMLGFSALLVWLSLAWRRAKGPLKFFALALFLCGLAEPQSPSTTPLLFLTLGMAFFSPSNSEKNETDKSEALRKTPNWVTAMSLVLAVPAIAGGLIFINGELHFEKASHGLSRSDSKAALNAFPAWSYPAVVQSIIEDVRGQAERDPSSKREVRRWLEEAIRRDPTDHALWLHLGDFLIKHDDYVGAGRAYRNALIHNPVSTKAPIHLAELANGAGDIESAIKWLEQALRVVPEQPNIQEALSDLRKKAEREHLVP